MCDRVLNNESFYALRMCKYHAKTDRATIILHVKRVARESKRFGEVVHDLGQVIESVREFLRVRPVGVPKARVIRSDKMKSIREPGEKRVRSEEHTSELQSQSNLV